MVSNVFQFTITEATVLLGTLQDIEMGLYSSPDLSLATISSDISIESSWKFVAVG